MATQCRPSPDHRRLRSILSVKASIWAALAAIAAPAQGADIRTYNIDENLEAIFITGEITQQDVAVFRNLSIRYPNAVVILDSDGGQVIPAMDIGRIIRLAGYETVVLSNSICTSSCALIWVAGSTRYLSPNGRVGFHASYRDEGGTIEESGVANAMVGQYLTLLNFSQQAVIFATIASPDQIAWLDRSNSHLSGIEFVDFDPRNDNEIKSSSVASQPTHVQEPAGNPSASTGTPPRPVFAPPNSLVPQYINDDWVEYAQSEMGTVYSYNLRTIRRSGATITVWQRANHEQDNTISHRETKSLAEYNCSAQTLTLISYIKYDSRGEVIDSGNIPTYSRRADHLVPDSIGMALWEEIC